MTFRKLFGTAITLGLAVTAASGSTLEAPAGFTIETLNFEVPNARQMALSDNGTLYVGTRRKGVVYAVPEALTTAAPEVVEIASGLKMPSGIALKNGHLYIGALNKIIRINDVDRDFSNADREVITQSLPDKRHHGWKYLKFGPDGLLYVPVGAPCNICLSKDPRFASILTLDIETGQTDIWAHGVRNTVGFDWHPVSGALWFSDNGRDQLGDDRPPEEINVSTQRGQHFGYPFVHGDDIGDPKFGTHSARPAEHVGPRIKIQAHSAALGIDFYEADSFPEVYQHALFIAEHGSWNRSSKVGYQVSVIMKDETYRPFVTGWLSGENASGRPNDVLITPRGELLISDDQQGVIYRVRYAG